MSNMAVMAKGNMKTLVMAGVGGLAGTALTKYLKNNIKVEFLTKNPWIYDAVVLVLALFLMNTSKMKDVGLGLGVASASNILASVFDMVAAAT